MEHASLVLVISAARSTWKDKLLDRAAGVVPGTAPRALVVLAHPDDEVLALGGRLEQWQHALFVAVTDGAPTDGADARAHGFASLDGYREGRQRELWAAFSDAGLSGACLHLFRTEDGAAIPDQQAARHLPALARGIARLLRQVRPEVVLTHPYEGGHPDHDACAFAVHTANGMLGQDAVPVVEAPSYHAGPDGMVTGRFLPHAGAGRERLRVLSEAEREAKRRRLASFVSQQETLAQFRCEVELLREAPAYDFTRPPHAGELFYERYPWGMTGEEFRRLAAAAMAELGGGKETT